MKTKPTFYLRFENLDLTVSPQGVMRIDLPRTVTKTDLDLIFAWISHQTRTQLVRKNRGSYIMSPGFPTMFGATRIRGIILEFDASGSIDIDFSKAKSAMLSTSREAKKLRIIEPRRTNV